MRKGKGFLVDFDWLVGKQFRREEVQAQLRLNHPEFEALYQPCRPLPRSVIKFVCRRQGCESYLQFSLRPDGKFDITRWRQEHNHPFHNQTKQKAEPIDYDWSKQFLKRNKVSAFLCNSPTGHLSRAFVTTELGRKTAKYYCRVVVLTAVGHQQSLLKQLFFLGLTHTFQPLLLAFAYCDSLKADDFQWVVEKFRSQVAPVDCLVAEKNSQLQLAVAAINRHSCVLRLAYTLPSSECQSGYESTLLRNLTKCEGKSEFYKLCKQLQKNSSNKLRAQCAEILQFKQEIVPCFTSDCFVPFRHSIHFWAGLEPEVALAINCQEHFKNAVEAALQCEKGLVEQFRRSSVPQTLPPPVTMVAKVQALVHDCVFQHFLVAVYKSQDLKVRTQLNESEVFAEEECIAHLVQLPTGRFVCDCGYQTRNGLPCQHLLHILRVEDQSANVQNYICSFWKRGSEGKFFSLLDE